VFLAIKIKDTPGLQQHSVWPVVGEHYGVRTVQWISATNHVSLRDSPETVSPGAAPGFGELGLGDMAPVPRGGIGLESLDNFKIVSPFDTPRALHCGHDLNEVNFEWHPPRATHELEAEDRGCYDVEG
jgi:hypothetical protein